MVETETTTVQRHSGSTPELHWEQIIQDWTDCHNIEVAIGSAERPHTYLATRCPQEPLNSSLNKRKNTLGWFSS